MYITRKKERTAVFIILIYIFVFQDLIQHLIPPLRVIDEVFALLSIPLFLLALAKRDYKYTFAVPELVSILLLLLFVITGWVGTLINNYQPMSVALSDCLVSVKFFLAIAASYFLFEDCNFKDIRIKIWPLLNFLTISLFLLCIFDLAFGIFESEDRFGLPTEKLFYSAYTAMAAQCCFLVSVYLRLYEEYQKKIVPFLLMLSFMMLSTMRMKAICAVLVLFFLFMILCCHRRQLGFISWSIVGAGAILLSARQFMFYFGKLKNESARGLLTSTSFKLAKDHFPFGTGWGTYGSAFSTEPYSPVYYHYHLSRVWGLSPKFNSFVSDTFWPMLLGECGWIGTLLYLSVVLILTHSIFGLGKKNAYACAAGLLPILYLFISSTSESAFVNTFAVPLAFLLGYLFAENRSDEMI